MRNKGVLWYVFAGSRGGQTRICIMERILRKPENPRQLALAFGVDYSTITHSLRVLEKNRLVYTKEKKYGATYMPSPEFLAMQEEFNAILEKHKCIRIPQKVDKHERGEGHA